MSDNDHSSGIFDGTDGVIASFFELRENQHLKQRSVSRGLYDPGTGDRRFLTLISDLFDCIETNHSGRPPSRENWRSKRVTTLSDRNKSSEVLLERAVTCQILIGDCREVLAGLAEDSVHCVVCSPPYWGLRDFGVAGQLGMEATLAEHIEVMVAVFREVRRVLRGDGTLWLNYGELLRHVGERALGGGHQGRRREDPRGGGVRGAAAQTALSQGAQPHVRAV
jgi:hypothetical protein